MREAEGREATNQPWHQWDRGQATCRHSSPSPTLLDQHYTCHYEAPLLWELQKVSHCWNPASRAHGNLTPIYLASIFSSLCLYWPLSHAQSPHVFPPVWAPTIIKQTILSASCNGISSAESSFSPSLPVKILHTLQNPARILLLPKCPAASISNASL